MRERSWMAEFFLTVVIGLVMMTIVLAVLTIIAVFAWEG